MKLLNKIKDPLISQKIQKLILEMELDKAQFEIEKLTGTDLIVGKVALGQLYSLLVEAKITLELVQPHFQEIVDSKDYYLEGQSRFLIVFSLLLISEFATASNEIQEWEVAYEHLMELNPSQARFWQSNLTFTKGILYLRTGRVDMAIDYLQRSLLIAKEIGGKSHIAIRHEHISFALYLKGELELAKQEALRSLEIIESIKNKLLLPGVVGMLGIIEIGLGNLDMALKRLERSHEIFQEISAKTTAIALPIFWIGKIYYRKGNLDKAHRYLCESVKLFDKMNDKFNLSRNLLDLIFLSKEMNLPDQTQKYLIELENLFRESSIEVISIHYRLAKAFILRHSKRLHQQMKAYEKFSQLIQEGIKEYDLAIFAILNLCEVLMIELKSTGEQAALEEIEVSLQKLIDLSQKNNAFEMIVDVFILQSKVYLIQGKENLAKKTLDEAQIMSERKNLPHLVLKISTQKELMNKEIEKWIKQSSKHTNFKERLEKIELQNYINEALQTVITEQLNGKFFGSSDQAFQQKYELIYQDVITEQSTKLKAKFRVGISQIGVSNSGNLLNEFYEEIHPDLFGLQTEKIGFYRSKIKKMVELAKINNVNFLIFPELSIDLNHREILLDILKWAKKYNMYIIPGSYHNKKSKRNICPIISPSGVLYEQVKHIPATITYEGKQFTEGIDTGSSPRISVICDTIYGRIVVVICRDFLDMDLRVELKNFEPPIDLIFNIAFTPVTADFKAAHFDARRSIYAYCFFANIAEFGDSFIYSPEKEQVERTIPLGKEDMIYKDIDLFKLRSERKKWELKQKGQLSFIQSTRN